MTLPINVLEASFDLVAPRRVELVERFYTHLFASAPEVRPLFAGTDMVRQRQMLLGTLVLLRQSLRDLDRLAPVLEAMGARHVPYGVRPDHYPLVGAALLAAFADIGGCAWRDEYTWAWGEVYQVVQEIMLRGAARSSASPESPSRPAA
jgi:methyl-accepting chemotaxis protein